MKGKKEGKLLEAVLINYEHLVTLIPDEYGLKGALNYKKNTRQHKSQPCSERMKFEDFNRLNRSNLSDLSLDQHKHSLVGYLIPTTK